MLINMYRCYKSNKKKKYLLDVIKFCLFFFLWNCFFFFDSIRLFVEERESVGCECFCLLFFFWKIFFVFDGYCFFLLVFFVKFYD